MSKKDLFPYRPPVTCVRCGKELKALEEKDDQYEMVDGGVVEALYAPYGSRHDGTVFQIGVCDNCLDALKPIGDYMCPDENAAIRYEERMKKFKETGTYTVGE
jgi:hypothetical protein